MQLHPQRAPLRLTVVALLGIIVLSSGCSRFSRAWKAAGESPQAVTGIEGRWEGVWLSDHNGHTGRLRCLITHQSNEVYQAWFHAKFQRIFSFDYKAILEVTPSGNVFEFDGAADLGTLAGGLYEYKGKVEDGQFQSTYKAKYDFGTFRMER